MDPPQQRQGLTEPAKPRGRWGIRTKHNSQPKNIVKTIQDRQNWPSHQDLLKFGLQISHELRNVPAPYDHPDKHQRPSCLTQVNPYHWTTQPRQIVRSGKYARQKLKSTDSRMPMQWRNRLDSHQPQQCNDPRTIRTLRHWKELRQDIPYWNCVDRTFPISTVIAMEPFCKA